MKLVAKGTLMAFVVLGLPTMGITSNLLTNSDFESPVASNGTTAPASWSVWLNPAGTGQAYISTQYAYTGQQSFVVNGTNCGALQQVAATMGSSYTASVYAMSPGLAGNAQGYLDLYFFNSEGTEVGGSSTRIFCKFSGAAGGPLGGSVGTSGWNYFDTTVIAPSETSFAVAEIQLWNPSGGGSVYFDDAALGQTVPEPCTLALLATGAAGLVALGCRRRFARTSMARTFGEQAARAIASFSSRSSGTVARRAA